MPPSSGFGWRTGWECGFMGAHIGLAQVAWHGPSLRLRKRRSRGPENAVGPCHTSADAVECAATKSEAIRYRVISPHTHLPVNECHAKVRLLIALRARRIVV